MHSKQKTILTLIILIIAIALNAQSQDLLQRRISITATDTPIASVLTTLGEIAGCNIVVATEVATPGNERLVTVSLRNVPFETALSTIVQTVGLSYRFMGENTFIVGPRENMRIEVGERSYIIPLNYTQAEKIVKAFEPFGGNVIAIEGQNALMVYANPETYADIRARVTEMDIPQQQIEIRARLIEVNINDTKRMGIDWSKLNSLTTIIAENPVNQNGVGLPYNYFDETGALPFGNMTAFQRIPDQQYFQKIDGFSNVGRFSRQLTAFDITIDWLLENNAAKLLSEPRIIALNGEEAEIFIGEITPFVVMDSDKQVQVEREETGIRLVVRPTVNKDGQITAAIAPEVSSITDLVGGYVPRVRMRQARTIVTVPNGQKIHIGGLLSSNSVTTTNKVPFLGSIPLIGRFFQYQYNAIQNTDLVIEITPRLVNIAEEQYDYEVDSRMGRELIKRIHENEKDEENEENETNEEDK